MKELRPILTDFPQKPTDSKGHPQARGLQFLRSLPWTALWPTGKRQLDHLSQKIVTPELELQITYNRNRSMTCGYLIRQLDRLLQTLWLLIRIQNYVLRTASWPRGKRDLDNILHQIVTPDQNYGPKPGSETLEEARLREAREKVKSNLRKFQPKLVW